MDFPTEETTKNIAAERGRGALVKIAIFVVVLLVCAGLYALYLWKYGEKTEEIGNGNTKTVAASGKVISDFPKELIIEKGADLADSYSIHYSDKANQPVLGYVSKESFSKNVEMVAEYLFNAGWEVRRAGSASEYPVTMFYGYRDSEEVNVAIFEEEGKVNVSIAYLKHN
ncbi:MAG: hypothetical protein AAB495_04550 [Patescibacteria group bacterium]